MDFLSTGGARSYGCSRTCHHSSSYRARYTVKRTARPEKDFWPELRLRVKCPPGLKFFLRYFLFSFFSHRASDDRFADDVGAGARQMCVGRADRPRVACQFILVDSTLIMSVPTINNGSSAALSFRWQRLCLKSRWYDYIAIWVTVWSVSKSTSPRLRSK